MSTVTRTAETDSPILDVLADRWSPRAFSDAPLDARTLSSALEAARWSPSANNSQPWRFIVGTKGTATFDTIVANLVGFNQSWAGAAGALVVTVVETADEEGNPRQWAAYDAGQAVAHLSVQAHHDGLFAHQMAGFLPDGIRDAFQLPAALQPITVTALGELGDPESLNEVLREREVAPRTRFPLSDIVLVQE
ncbi:nitroreductase family protein [Plantibacter sp. Mn2098]|uniref:nitroreductase family protein n=1 Tax=Plantibacter sp. Mn2098 TaxID=3395266 RepID=UPI003BC67945